MEVDEEGGYVVSIPALPGCFTHGMTYDDALSNIREAFRCYVKAMHKLKQPLPVDKKPLQSMKFRLNFSQLV